MPSSNGYNRDSGKLKSETSSERIARHKKIRDKYGWPATRKSAGELGEYQGNLGYTKSAFGAATIKKHGAKEYVKAKHDLLSLKEKLKKRKK